ncbi:UNVERIFIED_CONTAM: hypothetical protein Scaly_0287000 [Sesamum calycinum]|uniref:RING-type domain-containing protein n=1 Tax=Sesamum calycinum TaxID=2727403 RepID=A0AAW2SAV8_9LAMI
MSSAPEIVGLELVQGLQDLAIHEQADMKENCTAAVEEINQGGCDTNNININNHHGVCAICLNKIVLQETALVKGCEHGYCVTCILRWASCKKEPTCPQCKHPFEFLHIHRALDGSIHDYMFEESVCLLLRAAWFKPLVEVEKEEVFEVEEYEYDDEEDDLDEAGPSHQHKKKETPAKELVGRRAKRALKREAADKAAAAKHQQLLVSRDCDYENLVISINDREPRWRSLRKQLLLEFHFFSGDQKSHPGCPESGLDEHGFLWMSMQNSLSLTIPMKSSQPGSSTVGAKNYMDDQLLGFALVPISSVSGKGKVTQDFDLSSTDLFHSPAGTIKLSLSLNAKTPLNNPLSVPFTDSVADSAATPELLLDKQIPDEYSRIEFPDMNIVNQNQQMVSEYFAKNGTLLRPWPEKPDGSFLHLGAAPDVPVEDYEMVGNSSDEYRADSVSPDGSIQNSGFLSSTMTSLSDDRNSADSMEKKSRFFTDFSTSPDNNASSVIAETPTSKKKNESSEEKEPNFSGKEEESKQELSKNPVSLVRNIKLEAEESAMQQQIVDMYMRSMQQFTESLAKMKLPMDLDKPHGDDQGDVIQNSDKKMEIEKKKKDNSRVFYGSRAFF